MRSDKYLRSQVIVHALNEISNSKQNLVFRAIISVITTTTATIQNAIGRIAVLID
jgi:hypothetical protein